MNNMTIMESQPATYMPYQCTQEPIQIKRIRKIQMLHNDEPCFATDKRFDCAEMCEWRRYCRKPKAVWMR